MGIRGKTDGLLLKKEVNVKHIRSIYFFINETREWIEGTTWSYSLCNAELESPWRLQYRALMKISSESWLGLRAQRTNLE